MPDLVLDAASSSLNFAIVAAIAASPIASPELSVWVRRRTDLESGSVLLSRACKAYHNASPRTANSPCSSVSEARACAANRSLLWYADMLQSSRPYSYSLMLSGKQEDGAETVMEAGHR